MNERQTWFCYAVAQGIPPEEARKKAGYRKKGFEKQLMQDQKIQQAIAQYKAETSAKAIAKHDEILFFLTTAMRGENDADMRIRMKAAELLGKRVFERANDEVPIVIVDDVT